MGRLRLVLLITQVFFAVKASAAVQFNGFWGSIGVEVLKALSTDIAYDYQDRHAGSLSPPGFTVLSEYEQQGEGMELTPSVKLLYIGSLKRFHWGLSLGVSQPKLEMASPEFDLAVPEGWPVRPLGYSMKTIVTSNYAANAGLELGAGLSNSLLLFAKLGYHTMQGHVATESKLESGLIQPVFTEVSEETSFSGLGIGGGLRYLYSQHLYLEAAYEQVRFAVKTLPGSALRSSPDEVTMTQTQISQLGWQAVSISTGIRF